VIDAPLDVERPRPDDPVRRPSLVAGAALLALSALAAVGYVVIVQGLVTPGDGAATARDILGSDTAFRLGVTMLYAVVVLDVVVAWALFRVFAPVSLELARLAAWLRLAYSVVFMVAIGQIAGVPDLLDNAAYSGVWSTEEVAAQALLRVDAFTDLYMAGLILFGVHLALVGVLSLRSGSVPRLIGILLVIAGAGYAFDSVVTVLTEGTPFAVSTVTFLGEFLLALWLVFRGGRPRTV
jgi:hypothetical protein